MTTYQIASLAHRVANGNSQVFENIEKMFQCAKNEIHTVVYISQDKKDGTLMKRERFQIRLTPYTSTQEYKERVARGIVSNRNSNNEWLTPFLSYNTNTKNILLWGTRWSAIEVHYSHKGKEISESEYKKRHENLNGVGSYKSQGTYRTLDVKKITYFA